ncbi:replication protein [Oceanobacillus caeni]|uniref:replication protein n=1 Tax=Oceanobacillus caeni TaxID=405946 RepID=UPI00214A8244|nr:replication protein [Oceanobacillus caeni]MCR1835000.1 replication protein [Oceanobacillus caeni]
MANPQLHNGHTRIANEILDQIIKTNLNGTQFRLVMAIWRYTYGFQRKFNEMSVSFLAEKLNTSRSHVDRELKALIERRIITVVEMGQKGARVLQFNKNHKEWSDKEPEGKSVPLTLKNKKPVKTNKKPKYSEDNTYYKMAIYFHGLVEKVGQEAGLSHLTKKANMQTWADDFRKLIELDKVDKRLAKKVMDWVVQDDFWKTNILSASKLRKQFPQLAIKMNAQRQPQQPKIQSDHRDKEIEFQQWIQGGGDPDEFNWNG